MSDPEEKDPPGSKFFLLPQRVILSIMGFLSIVNGYTMRICLSPALTQMVILRNKTEVKGEVVCEPDFMDPDDPTGGEYDWSEELQGLILASFYIGYVITHVPGGMLADKFGGKWTLVVGVFATAILTILTPICVELGGPYVMVALRIGMGMGEGVMFPALNVLLAQWVPIKERGILGSLVLGGGQVGSILGNSISGKLLQHFKWPMVFYFFGILSCVWCILFVLMCTNDPITHPFIKVKEKKYLMDEIGTLSRNRNLPPVPWLAIFSSIPMWALLSAQVGHDFGFYVMITDLPKYMNDILQFSIAKNGLYSSLPNVSMWIFSLLTGAIADCLISRKIWSITNTRKFMTGLAAFGPAVFIVAASYAKCDRLQAVSHFTIAMGLMGAFYAGMKLTPLDMAPNYAGTLMAITNGIGAIPGVIAPYLVGVMTPNGTMFEWTMVFWVSFVVLVVTAIVYCIWASGDIQPFNDPTTMKKKKEED